MFDSNILGVIIVSVENSNTLSHLSVRVLNCRVIARIPEVHPKVFNGKTCFRDLTHTILNFVLAS